jgi:hypothetical protein
MNIYLIKNQQNNGPYTKAEVMNRIGAGEFTLNDMAWCDGCAGAVPLSQIIAPPGRLAQPHKLPMNRPTAFTQIASKKKIVSLLTVPWVFLGIMPMPSWLLPLETLGFLIVPIAIIIVSCQLARLLQKNVLLWFGLTLVPLVNLFAVMRLVSQASLTLKQNAVRTGLADAP